MKRVIAFQLFSSILLVSSLTLANSSCWIKPLSANPEKVFDPNVLKTVTNADEIPSVLGPLKDNWALVHRSGSPQTADYRVISYSPDGQIVVAYTGCPVQKDGKTIPYPKEAYPECEMAETMQLVYPQEEIKLKAYSLPGKFHSLKTHPVKVIDPREDTCLGCHGSKPQPIWAAYNTWPGVFGSRSRDGEDVMRKGSSEHQLYSEFVDRIFADPAKYEKYTKLTWRLNAGTMPEEIAPESLKEHLDKGEIPVRIRHSGTTQPAPELNKMFSEWRGRMLQKQIVQSEQYQSVRYAMMSLSLGCGKVLGSEEQELPITEFMPASMTKHSLSELDEFIQSKIASDKKANDKPINQENPFDNSLRYRIVGGAPNGRAESQLLGFAYIWKSLGYEFSNWNTSLSQTFNFNDGRSAFGPLFKTFWEYNDTCDPEMEKYSKYLQYEQFAGVTPRDDVDPKEVKKVCEELRKKGKSSDSSVAKPKTSGNDRRGHENEKTGH